jgi:RHH-type transcriptional regulator, proline utilization regulon repressor / proline dehydrogenase / delta 1-pyrroline-5-carboxylate dehydrogenase
MNARPGPQPDTHSIDDLRAALRRLALQDEPAAVERVLGQLEFSQAAGMRAKSRAAALVAGARARAAERPLIDSFLHEFGLSNAEGIALMCLAEALLRIPDDETADRLIAEKIAQADWAAHQGQSTSLFVNASTWALMLTGRIVDLPEETRRDPGAWMQRVTRRVGEPMVRTALRRAMRIIGGEFVVGRTIEEALRRSHAQPDLALCSFDMLGEGARTAADAARYLKAYQHALAVIGADRPGEPLMQRSALSIKLSALEPRFDLLHRDAVLARLGPPLLALARQAAQAGIGLTLDAEEADRLDLSLDLLTLLAADRQTQAWPGLGVAVQAYGLRALPLIDWLAALARLHGRNLAVRLVKGAYWDAEIKRAQERGLHGYPVYTRKVNTDVSYLSGAARLFAHAPLLYPQFATHNAYSVAAILEMRPPGVAFEFQRLHGMGTLLYDEARRHDPAFPPIRAYAPVGRHEDLLAYLVRRLLENGANTSFVNRFMDEAVPVEEIVEDPVTLLERTPERRNLRIPEPAELYGAARRNSRGVDWGDPAELARLRALSGPLPPELASAAPLIGGEPQPGKILTITNPANRRERVGECAEASAEQISAAMDQAANAQPQWDAAGAGERAACLLRAADLLAEQRDSLLQLLVKEAGKTWPDAVSEVREAEDFCRYYAYQARLHLGEPLALPGPTGERNTLSLHGRGVFACISPWNFPLAIFTGQVVAALAAGNSVVAKPAEATPLIAMRAVRMLHQAGVPGQVLQLLPCPGRLFGQAALAHPALAGVALTGSTATAQLINRSLAARDGAILPFIAETGGINAMVVDSSALLEQVVDDAISSAFTSAGQRCSALRLLYVQDDVADALIEMLSGAMDELIIGDPADPATDVGPVISAQAAEQLEAHATRLRRQARMFKECRVPSAYAQGHFVAPKLFELNDGRELGSEQFGPILHLVRYPARALDSVLETIRTSGYGLTLGIHSRISGMWQQVVAGTRVGNTYVNRNMIGAVVGVQPFGGEGLSGTGPKAGGPHYLLRFTTERTLTVNTVATGGNAELLSQSS